ncbi:hypothetical protein H4Q26_011469 [Puccinia striiformis f. sp. tritici PST-130]|nr:hypothetical protein H4Q26_011469 [Puccinia striiformis f. sp. tritici PST-130]
MPGLTENLRIGSVQGQNNLKLVSPCPQSTSFWASDISLIIAPVDGSSTSSSSSIIDETKLVNNLAAKVLDCSLSTGLFCRKCTKPLINI